MDSLPDFASSVTVKGSSDEAFLPSTLMVVFPSGEVLDSEPVTGFRPQAVNINATMSRGVSFFMK
jgi:hypothetical protein